MPSKAGRPSWCRAVSPEDCDFPAGCSACVKEREGLSAESLSKLIGTLSKAERPYAEMFLLGSSELLGKVVASSVEPGLLHMTLELTGDGSAFLRELNEEGAVPVWFRPTPRGLIGRSPVEPKPTPDLPGTLSLLNDLLGRMRGIMNERTDCGRMHQCAAAEQVLHEIKRRIVDGLPDQSVSQQAPDAVARPVSSKAGPSIRVAKRQKDQTPRTKRRGPSFRKPR